MATAAYLDRIPASKRWGGWLNYLKRAGIITDAQVAANATVTALKAALLSQSGLRPDQLPMVIKANKALDKAVSMGQVPETHGVITVDALVALGDSSSTFKQGFFG